MPQLITPRSDAPDTMGRMADARRLEWIVDQLDLEPNHRVLEIGGGHGVAATLVLERLTRGAYTGIDRSAKMIAASERRNADAVAAGRATFVLGEFPTETVDGSFDRIFAARVVSMIESSALAEVRRLLTTGGLLVLPFESPDHRRTGVLVSKAVESLGLAGFEIIRRAETTVDGHRNVCLVANRIR
jgi:ubiquinone/menaquinone biosynthesis C-methylase UbiE